MKPPIAPKNTDKKEDYFTTKSTKNTKKRRKKNILPPIAPRNNDKKIN